jgi:hypothetical protein
LPPNLEEVNSYLQDSSPTAYARAVDRALGSVRYGERWAQHWLDVIRFAETSGYEVNAFRSNASPYRDWVIRAFNSDLPYDRFVLGQIAGDTLSDDFSEGDAATGFLVAGPANLRGQIGRDLRAHREARQDELDEVVRATSAAFLGLTVGCARCHKHKFDPISQREYYQLQATFAGLRYGERRLRGAENDRWQADLPASEERVAALEAQAESLRRRWGLRPPVTPGAKTPAARRSERLPVTASWPVAWSRTVYVSSSSLTEPTLLAAASTGTVTASSNASTTSTEKSSTNPSPGYPRTSSSAACWRTRSSSFAPNSAVSPCFRSAHSDATRTPSGSLAGLPVLV